MGNISPLQIFFYFFDYLCKFIRGSDFDPEMFLMVQLIDTPAAAPIYPTPPVIRTFFQFVLFLNI